MKAKMQSGFLMISAIFILVVLAMLGAFAAGISGAQQLGSAQDLQSSRVYQAARAGLEWGLYMQQRSASCALSTNLAMPATATTLSNISVTVACTSSGGVAHITSTACNQPNAAGAACPNTTTPTEFYAERQVEIFLQ